MLVGYLENLYARNLAKFVSEELRLILIPRVEATSKEQEGA